MTDLFTLVAEVIVDQVNKRLLSLKLSESFITFAWHIYLAEDFQSDVPFGETKEHISKTQSTDYVHK